MSKRHGMRSVKGDNVPVKKMPPSHEILERILGVNHVLMCRGCRFKLFCKKVLSCEEESRIEAKLSFLTATEGEEKINKLTPPQLVFALNSVTDKEAYEYMKSLWGAYDENTKNNSGVVQEKEGGNENEAEGDKVQERSGEDGNAPTVPEKAGGDEVQEQTGEDSNTPAVSENENSK